MTMDNVGVALRTSLANTDPATWLEALDLVAEHQLDAAIAAGDLHGGYAAYGRHLERTEHTRRRLHGAGPTQGEAAATYIACFSDHFTAVAGRLTRRLTDPATRHHQHRRGASTSPTGPFVVQPVGTKDAQPAPPRVGASRVPAPSTTGRHLTLASSAPSSPGTERAEREVCGHHQRGLRHTWECTAEPHPDQPAAHYFEEVGR